MSDAIRQAAVAAIGNTVKVAVAQDMAQNSKKIQEQAAASAAPSPAIAGGGANVDMKV
ncbi:hypothetical protein GCM10017044_14630 [Kordiimonas sediminis]|uniref:Motility protein n=1 Tax=Kordiimonas sediminis TaxID=1735581 RepID=A0A919APX7_9PROT|nr:hypothetical protein [Kordiimonas sediminis]GHF20793.1 hypothetical protein GCM10017044_14630 [Kordiimonas sediminis]